MGSVRSPVRFGGCLWLGLLLGLFLMADAALAREMEKCTRCHDETSDYPVLSILKTRHAVQADPRIPFGTDGCEACHGDASDHMRPPAEGEKRTLPPVTFSKGTPVPPEERNAVCLQCHESGDRMHWRGSRHEFRDVACVSCHTIHTDRDRVLDRREQPAVCVQCHTEKRVEMLKPSAHPVSEGRMACSDCHNPHGSTGPNLLREPTLNETCYGCHAEKRGPFLWEHAPAREDCSLCHNAHGSVHPSLLKTRGPWLCQQCHLGTHSSGAFTDAGVGGTVFMAGQSCLNCHSQVHGTNNPAGPRYTR